MTVFPLPLTPYEEYQFLDDYPAYPNTIAARFRFSGRIDLERFHEAVRQTLARHPLACCGIERLRSGIHRHHWHWVPRPIESFPIEIHARHQTNGMPHLGPIDLHHGVAGKAILVIDDESTDLIIQGHHAFVDGVGGLQILIDWMLLYDRLANTNSKTKDLPACDLQDLRRRGDFGFRTWNYWKKAHRYALGLYGVHEFFMHEAASLLSQPRYPLDTVPEPPYPRSITFESDETDLEKHLQQAAKRPATANEMLLSALFQAIAAFRRERQIGSENDWLRLMVPMNLRELKHRKLPAANRVSFISLDRRANQCFDPKALLRSIHGQMKIIHDHDLRLTFHSMLNVGKWLPRGLKTLAKPDRCGATAILTNLGEPFRRLPLRQDQGKWLTGELRLEGQDLLPPLRPNTQVAFAAFRYAGRQCLTLNFDPRSLDAASAQALLDDFTTRAFPRS